MSTFKSISAALAGTVVLAAMPLNPALAAATPSEGVDGIVMSQATYKGKDYVTKQLTIAPGGTTGWHYHPGQIYGLVREGTLTHYRSNCTVDGVYETGASISEASGPGYIHMGRNEGTTPLVLWVLYIDPAGSPLAIDAPDPGCQLP